MHESASPIPLRILHLEDEPKDVMLVQAALEVDGLACDVEHVDTGAQFEAALEHGEFDLILSDFALPGFGGLAALERARTVVPDVPFVFVSGTIGEETAIAAVRNGATDYVLKHRLSHLAPAVRRAIAEAQERARRRKMEEALRESQERLRQAQKMEAIGRLAAGVAHDFNNMLTAILGYAQLAKMRLGADSPVASDLVEIRKAGERAAGLTRQLLAFSRQQVLQPRALDLNTVVVDLDKMLRRLIGADVELLARPGKDLGRVMADPGQIEQILLNLAVNARDAMPRGGRVTIETSETTLDEHHARTVLDVPPGGYVVLSVSDDGEGMDAETMTRIFEPFFTTKDPGKGTGLGLSTVFGIVKQSGGGIEVYSRPGHGATFKLYFPRVEAQAEAVVSLPRDLPAAAGTETVLVAEDDDAVRRLVHRTLTLHGYRVHESRNGHEAIRMLESDAEGIDLLITDIVMPGLGGAELLARVASVRPDLKVLCVSGHVDWATVHRAAIGSGTPFLHKPFTPEALAQKVREVLDGEERRQAA